MNCGIAAVQRRGVEDIYAGQAVPSVGVEPTLYGF